MSMALATSTHTPQHTNRGKTSTHTMTLLSIRIHNMALYIVRSPHPTDQLMMTHHIGLLLITPSSLHTHTHTTYIHVYKSTHTHAQIYARYNPIHTRYAGVVVSNLTHIPELEQLALEDYLSSLPPPPPPPPHHLTRPPPRTLNLHSPSVGSAVWPPVS